MKDFPKVTEDPHIFAEEFNIVIQTYQSGFSDLYELLYVLVGERSLGLQPGDYHAADLLYKEGWEITDFVRKSWAFPKSADWDKIHACSQKSDEAAHDCYT